MFTYEPNQQILAADKYRRLNTPAGRYYMREAGSETIDFAPSVTTIIDAMGLGLPAYLKEELIIKHGANYRKWLGEKASYGTALHRLVETIIKNDTEITTLTAENVLHEELNRKPKTNEIDDIMSDLASIVQFLNDTNAKILATEFMLFGQIAGKNVCGTVDILAELDVEYTYLDHENPFKSGERKGEPRPTKGVKRQLYLLDLKSGKWGFSDGHKYQLMMYRELFCNQFGLAFYSPNIANIAPAEWRTAPAYKFKEHTLGYDDSYTVDNIVKTYYSVHYKEPKQKKTITGITRSGISSTFEGWDYEQE